MMHDHDFELIAAIAEGALDPEEQAAAEDLLTSCLVCSTDLQLQLEALAFLRLAPPMMMTDLERASLHRSVTEKLAPAARSVPSQARIPWFQRLLPAMAAAAALVAVVGVGSMLINGSGGADIADETTAAATAGDGQSVEEELAQNSSAAAEGVAEPTTTIALAAPNNSNIREYGAISAAELADIARQLTTFPETDDQGDFSRESLQSLSFGPALFCTDAALDEGSISAIGRATVDGEDAEIYRIDEKVNVYSIADCSLLHRFD
jgi:hypothetical protein